MGSGQGSRVAQGRQCDAKWVYHQENTGRGIPKICLNNRVVPILLVDNCVHIYSPFPPQCRNKLCPHEYNVTVCVHRHLILILAFNEVWPEDAILSNDKPHSHFLLAKWAMGMFMELSLSPEVHILLADVPTQVTVSLVTKENQMQQAMMIFNPLTDVFRNCSSFCFIVISFPLQGLNFVRKELKVIKEDPQNWCSWNTSFLWETTC